MAAGNTTRDPGLDLQDRRELNNGFGETSARAFELVLTPIIFGVLGYLLDRRLGTSPLFMLGLGLFTFGYVVWRTWTGYDRRMSEQENQLGLGRPRGDRDG